MNNYNDDYNEELFKNPPAKFRGAPFWAWNTKLEKDELLRQIDIFKAMGIGGFHIHCRSGLETEYLGEEYMELVGACNEKAKKEEMLCYLYDEDRWPSGSGGGLVTKDRKYRARYLSFGPADVNENDSIPTNSEDIAGRQEGDGKSVIARFAVTLKDGFLQEYKRLQASETAPGGTAVWEATLVIAEDNPWFNNQAYVNTLDKKAIERFIEVTHEKYYEKFGDDFGTAIPSIFTDEPQFTHKQTLKFSTDRTNIALPFTDDFEETYKSVYGESIIDHLPELVWELPDDKISAARYNYHDHVAERFSSAFADTVGNWCKAHNIKLTGHMMEEPTLQSQTAALGETMRSYRSFDVPGIDMLCDWREYTTAKQAQSAAHQYGRTGVLSELYGVTNWDFDFRNHKLQGDWQAALGVTLRVHHLTWVSMNGEAKRDYPASIGYQSPWYKEYSYIEDHFARLNSALTRGKAEVRVGVIHPVESYWLYYGPNDKTAGRKKELDDNFYAITNWLLFGLVDFDFIAESLLPSQAPKAYDGKLAVGEMEYETIIVPNCITLRSTTLQQLKAFKKAGGRLVFTGETPTLLDAGPSQEVQAFVKECECIQFNYNKIHSAISGSRDVDIINTNGQRPDRYIYQLRKDGKYRWLFICNAKPAENPDIPREDKLKIIVSGVWKPTLYDTLTGEIHPLAAKYDNGKTVISRSFYDHDSLLLLLEGGRAREPEKSYECNVQRITELSQPVSFSLSEPNSLVLDCAEYSFDGKEWNSRDEVLRIDNRFRELLGYPLRMEAWAQPWSVERQEEKKHILGLRYSFESEIEIRDCYLALENISGTEIIVNGESVKKKTEGYFVDKCIQKVKLPAIKKGTNQIILCIDFYSRTNVEWCYLLGSFGVSIAGSAAKLIDMPQTINFGDYGSQGFPFYTGNIKYHNVINVDSGNYKLDFSSYRSTVMKVFADGKERGIVAFAPYTIDLGELDKGEHSIDILCCGNRYNAFGALHNSDSSEKWHGPNSWRTEGKKWSYEYQLRKMGVLVTPRLIKY